MKFEKLLRLGPYAAFLQRRWRLAPARAAGALHNVFVTDYKCKKASLLETLRTHSKGWGGRRLAYVRWQHGRREDKGLSEHR